MLRIWRQLLERERELAWVGSAVAQGRQGHGRVAFTEASAGLGKASLFMAVCQAAAGLSKPLFAQTRALQPSGDGSFSMLHGLVRAVAVLGDGASLAEVGGLAGLAEEQVACAAGALGVLSCAR